MSVNFNLEKIWKKNDTKGYFAQLADCHWVETMDQNIWNLFDFVQGGDPESRISLSNSRYYLEISNNTTTWHSLNDTLNQGNYSGEWVNPHIAEHHPETTTTTPPVFEFSGIK